VAQAAAEGDRLAIELFERAGFYIGLGVVNLMILFNPGIVVIGGGVSQAGDLLFEPIRQTVQTRVDKLYRGDCPIVPAALGGEVGLLGALAQAIDTFGD
jgi:glucokinase